MVKKKQNCSLKPNQIKDNLLRLHFYSQTHLLELKESIKEHGLLEPLLVYKDISSGVYTLLNGHYRIRVLKQLQIENVQCNVIECNEKEAISRYISSFIKKTSLTALEEGHMISNLIQKGYTLKEIGEKWKKSTSWVSRRAKLLKDLDSSVKNDLKNGKVFPRIAQELARLPQGKEQKRVSNLVKKHHLTKDETSALVDKWLEATGDNKRKIEAEYPRSNMKCKAKEIEPKEMLKKGLLTCNQNLNKLLGAIDGLSELPKTYILNEYQTFIRLIDKLESSFALRGIERRLTNEFDGEEVIPKAFQNADCK